MNQTNLVKTWRLLSEELLTDGDIEYLRACNLMIRSKSYANEISTTKSGAKYYYNHAMTFEVTTTNDEEETVFLLRFGGRFALLNIMYLNRSFHSFDV